MNEFRMAVEAGDFEGMGDLLADNVLFRSPVAFRPYEGRPIVHAILRGVGRVFKDFHYLSEINDAHGRDQALLFEAAVDGVTVHGCDFLHLDDEGKISEFTVMVRPLSAANALAQAMGAQFEQIQAEAIAASIER
jgi:hypothetical protein